MDEGAPHEVLIRQARSALAEGSANEETMVRGRGLQSFLALQV